LLKSELTRLAGSSVIYGVGSILQRAVGVALLPFLSHALRPEEFGIAALLTLATVAASGLFNLGIAHSLPIYYFREVDIASRPRIIVSAVALVAVSSALFGLLLSATAPGISLLIFQTADHAGLLRMTFATLALSAIAEPLLCYLRMERQAGAHAILTLTGTLTYSFFALLFVLGLEWRVEGLILAGLLSAALLLAMAVAATVRQLRFSFDIALMTSLARTGLPAAVGLLAYFVIDYTDRQMIQRFAALDQVGIYSIGYSFGLAMLVLVNAFASAWSPFSMSFAHKRAEGAVIFAAVLRYYVIGAGLVTVAFFGVAKPIVDLIVASDFGPAYIVVGMVASAYMLKGCYIILTPSLQFEMKLRTQATMEWTAALLNIVLNVLLIPRLGIAGAALATLICYGLLAGLAFQASRKYLRVPYDWVRIGRAGSIIAVACAVEFWLAPHWSMTQGLAAAVIIFAICGLLLVVTALNATERHYLVRLLDIRTLSSRARA
jgi:O-antigen/teichoic acid export membrane protein